MSVKIGTRQVGDVTVADVNGKLTLGEGSSVLRETLRNLSAQGHQKVLLNLSGVTYLDSSGIGELVAGYTTITNSGGRLKLVNLTSKVQNPLQTTKLYTVFDIYEDETEGVKSFS